MALDALVRSELKLATTTCFIDSKSWSLFESCSNSTAQFAATSTLSSFEELSSLKISGKTFAQSVVMLTKTSLGSLSLIQQ